MMFISCYMSERTEIWYPNKLCYFLHLTLNFFWAEPHPKYISCAICKFYRFIYSIRKYFECPRYLVLIVLRLRKGLPFQKVKFESTYIKYSYPFRRHLFLQVISKSFTVSYICVNFNNFSVHLCDCFMQD